MLQLSGILQEVHTEQDRRDLRLPQVKDLRNQSANKEKLSILQVEKNVFFVSKIEQQKNYPRTGSIILKTACNHSGNKEN